MIFDCSQENLDWGTSQSLFTPFIERIRFYNTYIANKINTLKNTIENLYNYSASNKLPYTDTLESFKNELEKDEYQHFFNYAFDKEIYGEPDGINYNNLSYIDMIRDFFMDLQSHFSEYYLMCKTIAKYDCCFLETLRILLNFYDEYIGRGRDLCIFAQYIKDYGDYIDGVINYINTNNINKDDDYNTVQTQKCTNASNSYSNFLTQVIFYKSQIENKRDSIYDTFINKSVAFVLAIKIYLKVISLAQIILSANNEDADKLSKTSQVVLTYTETEFDQGVNYSMNVLYSLKEKDVINYGIPTIMSFRPYLASDWSNFDKISKQAITAAAGAVGLSSTCKNLYDYLTQN